METTAAQPIQKPFLIVLFLILTFTCKAQVKIERTDSLGIYKIPSVLNKEKVSLPNGSYVGYWTSYGMTIILPNKESYFVKNLLRGLRGINCKTNITIKDGFIYLSNNGR